MAGAEDRTELLSRHKHELRELESEARRRIKQANKNKKKVEEAERVNAERAAELQRRHEQELLEAQGAAGSSSDGADAVVGDSSAAAGAAEEVSAVAVEDEVAEALNGVSLDDKEAEEKAKRDKARARKLAKKDKKLQAEQERERRIAEEKAAAGPEPREVEFAIISAQIQPLGRQMSEIKADGHCLYRAVAAQLGLVGAEPDFTEENYPTVRRMAARQMRGDPGEYAPFLEVETRDGFEGHCAAVENSAEWGGQVELRALSAALRRPIEVFSANAPVLVLGEEYLNDRGAEPLRLSFHEQYYALGAHYNSVVPL